LPGADVAEPVQEGGEGEAAVHYWVGLCVEGSVVVVVLVVVVVSFFPAIGQRK